jgi:hypothetical protein
MTCYLLIEGQRIQLPDEITDGDDKIRRALAPIFPGASTAQLNRSVKDGVTEISVVKQAGTKGSAVLDQLRKARSSVNPIVGLYQDLQQQDLSTLTAEELLKLDQCIRGTLEEGQAQAEQMKSAKQHLMESAPRPAPYVPVGF